VSNEGVQSGDYKTVREPPPPPEINHLKEEGREERRYFEDILLKRSRRIKESAAMNRKAEKWKVIVEMLG
jgi:hypothetical protein